MNGIDRQCQLEFEDGAIPKSLSTLNTLASALTLNVVHNNSPYSTGTSFSSFLLVVPCIQPMPNSMVFFGQSMVRLSGIMTRKALILAVLMDLYRPLWAVVFGKLTLIHQIQSIALMKLLVIQSVRRLHLVLFLHSRLLTPLPYDMHGTGVAHALHLHRQSQWEPEINNTNKRLVVDVIHLLLVDRHLNTVKLTAAEVSPSSP
jgi:hypothetical protein